MVCVKIKTTGYTKLYVDNLEQAEIVQEYIDALDCGDTEEVERLEAENKWLEEMYLDIDSLYDNLEYYGLETEIDY